jgi:hypothetical protein
MFLIELKPKGLVFPVQEEDGAIFQIGTGAASVEDLRAYLEAGVDVFDGSQNWFYMDEGMLDQYVRVLPSPFNDPDVVLQLTFAKEDVVFDEAAQLICSIHDRAYSELELKALGVEELRLIYAAKSAKASSVRKADLVDLILLDQKSKGLSAVRVKQTSLMEVSC